MLEKALKELAKNNILLNSNFEEYHESNKTYIENNVLYYRNISEALMVLNDNDIVFKNKMKTFGTMIDVSRGAVFKVSYVKKLIREKALMGVNEIWMYMEDVYELEEYPYFGYMRGKYKKDELLEIISYAEIFGIKMIPAIQTLGHMEQFLKWHQSHEVKDQSNVLLAGNKKTYQLIKTMFKFLKETFKTDRIHIGMDETFGLGFGKYYKNNGYKHQHDIFIDHLEKVNDIALEEGFSDVLIWSDMFFRIASKTSSYYDPNIKFSETLLSKIPENVGLVYWDYYNTDLDLVKKMLQSHKDMNRRVIMASGTWVWVKFTYDRDLSNKTAETHIKACNDLGVDEFILTQWMDDGAYADHRSSLLGVYELGLKALTNNKVNKKAYKNITNTNYDTDVLASELNNVVINPQGLMWDDPLLGLYVNNYVGNNYQELEKHILEYEHLVNKFKKNKALEFVYHIAAANMYKLKARYTMISNYYNKKALKEAVSLFKEFESHISKLSTIFDNMWHSRNKLIGLEAIQSRFATLLVRTKEMYYIIDEYDKGNIKRIEAFEEKVGDKNRIQSLKHIGLAYSMRSF